MLSGRVKNNGFGWSIDTVVGKKKISEKVKATVE
jgi:hypothetical protein